MPIMQRIRRVFNAFEVSEQTRSNQTQNIGPSASTPPTRSRLRFYNDRSLISSIYTRIAIDVAGLTLRHVLFDENGQYLENAESTLNDCFLLEPNIDQGPRSFRQDLVTTLFDRGVAAVIPVDYEITEVLGEEPKIDILSLRIGEIVEWKPKHVRVSVYNEDKGIREEVTVEKRNVAIVENPLYAVMNEPNSTLQRLLRKLQLLDIVDEQSGSGKLDLIIQLPYVIKSEARRLQAEKRREDIEFQLKGSKYGIAYTDGTEKITQLNRPAENNLMAQVEKLIQMLYGQLGITEDIMNGTADEKTMNNYFVRTIEPILDAVIEAMTRSFLKKSGWARNERIVYFRNPFKLIPIADLAEVVDKFTRNEVLSSNEFRGYMGIPPSKDPKANQLVNSNMPQPDPVPPAPPGPTLDEMDGIMREVLDGLKGDLDKIGASSG